MKAYITIILVFLFHSLLSAQIGINAAYKTIDANIWETSIMEATPTASDQSKYFQNSYSFGIDYWFRLKNKRIEFTPELAFSAFKSRTFNYSTTTITQDLKVSFTSLMANINIYLFDFAGDCNCPTFSKDGDIMRKGFFLQVSPGMSYIQERHQSQSGSEDVVNNQNTVSPTLALGVGLDIGLSDFLTITPYAKVQRHFNTNWEGFYNLISPNEAILPEKEMSNIDQLQIGIRLGLRFDEINKYGFR